MQYSNKQVNNITLLIIEDVTEIRHAFSEYFTSEGFKVLIAKDGQEALDIVENTPNIDVVLLDLMLPKVEGLRVLEKIKETPAMKHIKIILSTVIGKDNVIKQAFNLGADGYIIKSDFDPNELMEMIKRLSYGKDEFFVL